jgi:hypothetical protein
MEWKKEAGDYAAEYSKLFSKYGIDPYTMEGYKVVVIEKKETFEKLGRKCYPKKATKEELTVLPLGNYLNTVTGVMFFHDRVERSYTRFGYIPYSMTCHNPDHTTKIRRTFDYIALDKMETGNREKDILDRLEKVEFEPWRNCLVFFAKSEIDGHADTFAYNIKTGQIIG